MEDANLLSGPAAISGVPVGVSGVPLPPKSEARPALVGALVAAAGALVHQCAWGAVTVFASGAEMVFGLNSGSAASQFSTADKPVRLLR